MKIYTVVWLDDSRDNVDVEHFREYGEAEEEFADIVADYAESSEELQEAIDEHHFRRDNTLVTIEEATI